MSVSPSIRALYGRIGYIFRTPAHLDEALCHPSFRNEQASGVGDHQRLEWLGDSVLGLLSTEYLFTRRPESDEGALTALRAEVTRTSSLARIAHDIGLGACLQLGQGERKAGGAERPSTLADALEAVLGAVYRDGGLDAARQVFLHLFRDTLEALPPDPRHANPKGLLQEELQAEGRMPEYRLLETTGPAHDRIFTVSVLVSGVEIGRGRERTKQGAEQAAARAARDTLKRG